MLDEGLLQIIAKKDGEIELLRAAIAVANKLADQYRADYERSVLNGDRLFDEVERLRAALSEISRVILRPGHDYVGK